MKKQKEYFTQKFFADINEFCEINNYTCNYYDIISNTYYIKHSYISENMLLELIKIFKKKYRLFIFANDYKLNIHININ